MPTLYDHRGEPIKESTLREVQTARLGTVKSEYETHPANGLTPARLQQIMVAGEEGDLTDMLDLFEDMEERDQHIFAEMSKRRRSVIGLEWDLLPPPDASAAEKKALELVKELLSDIALEDVLFDLTDAIGKGFSCMEIEWERYGNLRYPKAINHRPPRMFTVGRENRDELRLRDLSAEGQTLWPFGWIVHRAKAKSGYLARTGLYRVLGWPYLFKVYSIRDLAEFLEIYGLPLRVGFYPPAATDKEKATLLQAVVGIGHNAAGIMPEGMKVEFQEAAKGNSDPFQTMIEWCEKSESKAILGGTLTSQADGKTSTNALGNVHNDVRWDLTVSDAKQLATTLTRMLIYPLTVLNTSVTEMRRAPRFAFDLREIGDIDTLSKAIPQFVNMGMRIPQSWLHEELRIPQAAEDEEVLTPPGRQSPFVIAAEAKGEVKKTAVDALRSGDPTLVDDQVETLEEAMDDPMTAAIDVIRKLVQEVESLEELRDRLLEVFPGMSTDDLTAVMGEAYTAAALGGRHDILEDD